MIIQSQYLHIFQQICLTTQRVNRGCPHGFFSLLQSDWFFCVYVSLEKASLQYNTL